MKEKRKQIDKQLGIPSPAAEVKTYKVTGVNLKN
jgi:hypothetical protein